MRNLTIAAALAAGAVVIVAGAQQPGSQLGARAPFWPAVTGKAVVQEWYSDIPWHQKLGTFAGNEIDEAIVLPYDALPEKEKAFCTSKGWSQEYCMLELGINNILGALRIDTRYDPQDPKIKAAAECQDAKLPCIEVRLELSSFWSRVGTFDVDLVPRPFGTEPQIGPYGANYRGYAITDGSTYAPQMPWYMAHYCDSLFPQNARDVQDPVCYGDYFSPMNNGFNPLPATNFETWPKSQPWSVFPYGTEGSPLPPINHCKKDETKCNLAMAAFDLQELQPSRDTLQYKKYNENLLAWFNNALKSFATDFSQAELQRHFPWSGTEVSWETFLYPQAVLNPFLGQFANIETEPAQPAGCDVNVNGPNDPNCTQTAQRRGSSYVYPRQCTFADLTAGNAANLRKCSLNFELHHNGYLQQWPESFWPDLNAAGMLANQYGRTSFMFAGIPGMQMPVPFYKDPANDTGMNVYEQVYNASIFSLYLPITNAADKKHAFFGRNYTDQEFYHTLLMSNHMESDPYQFAEGMRGKVLWHNEYRTQKMYEAAKNNVSQKFPTRMFAASFNPQSAPSPYHSNTCDSCHVRNGSGIPINTARKLDPALQEFMKADEYNPAPVPDYTFTGQIRPMKLAFFDLKRGAPREDAPPPLFPPRLGVKPPLTFPDADIYYNNKIMNFYGDSFHVTTSGYGYSWSYEPVNPNRPVVKTARVNAELGKTYELRQIKLGTFQANPSCQLVLPPPTSKPWPRTCDEVNGAAVTAAIEGGEVGIMLLNGKRLGNLSAIEAIPNQTILGFRASQAASLGDLIAGEVAWSTGARDGVTGKVQKNCRNNSLSDCFIGRFGWVGDRVSLEDQVANAAFVEMNLTTSEGFRKLYSSNDKVVNPIRYAAPNCGQANKTCVQSKGNGDLTEEDVNRMADYARWLGNPTRSEFQVTLPEVIEGDKVFRQLKCDTCHVVRKIDVTPDDTMLVKEFRDRLATRVSGTVKPFLSYIGTDLLMHDMGYLSQVGTASEPIRDQDGVVLPKFRNYVQKIRTPALKGLQYNRFVTASQRNTKAEGDPACDFLLHDGRACDAIEAAFLHDGPAVKKLGVIEGLNALNATQLKQLRAFLYSL